jgi:HTH-type transcriptional regulator/antitoxin HipB
LTKSLGEQIKRRRRELGLRQEELADLANVSPSFVRFVEHDKASVRLDKVQDVLNVLGLEMTLELKAT